MRPAIIFHFSIVATTGVLAQSAMTRTEAEAKIREQLGVLCEPLPTGALIPDFRNSSLKSKAIEVAKYQKAGILDLKSSTDGSSVNLSEMISKGGMAGSSLLAEPAASAPKEWFCTINGLQGLNLGIRSMTDVLQVDKVQKKIGGNLADFYLVQATLQYSQSDIARKFYGYSQMRDQKMQALYSYDAAEKNWRLTRMQVVGAKDEFADIVRD